MDAILSDTHYWIADNLLANNFPDKDIIIKALYDESAPAFLTIFLFQVRQIMDNKSVSLDGLSVADLTALQAKIAEQIKVKHEETRQDVKNQILALLASSGFSFSDIFPSGNAPKAAPVVAKKKVSIKYSDGQHAWTGRGRMPLWVKSFVEAGGELASLEVSK